MFLQQIKCKIILFLSSFEHTEDTLKYKIVHSGFWVTISNIFIRILEFIRSIILAHLLTPEIFGLWSIVNFVRQSMEVFTQTGFGAAIIYRQNKVKEALNVAWVLNILRGFILSLLCFLLAPFVAQFYSKSILEVLLKVVSISFLIKGFYNINVVLFQKKIEFKKISILQQINVLVSCTVTIILAYYLRNIWALIFGTLIYFICDLLLSYIIQPIKPQFYFNKTLALEILSYGIFVTGSGIIIFLTTELDNALVGKILGMKVLGYYVLAYTLANLPATQITHIISKVMFPAYSQLQDNLEKLRNFYLKTLKVVTTFAIPAAGGLFVLAPEIIKVIYGEKWLSSVPILRVLCFYGVLRAIAATFGPFFYGIGKPKYDFYGQILRLVVILLTLYPLTVKFSLLGTGISVFFSVFLVLIYFLYVISDYIPIKEIILPILINSSVCLIMIIFIKLIKNRISYINLPILFCLVFIGICVNFIVLYCLQKLVNNVRRI